jgi:hypothetical protein
MINQLNFISRQTSSKDKDQQKHSKDKLKILQISKEQYAANRETKQITRN